MRRPMLWRGLALLVAAWLWVSGVAWGGDEGGEKVVLVAADGHQLAGLLARPQQRIVGGVVLLHMYRHNKEGWQPLVTSLRQRGLVCLAIDMRGHGESLVGPDGLNNQQRVVSRDPTLFNAMHLDAEAAVRYLQDKVGIDEQAIALVGASVGCSVAIHTVVAGAVEIAATVAMTPGRNYLAIPTMEHLAGWPGIPLLILSSRQEMGRGADVIARRLAAVTELRIFEEEDIHGTNMFGEVDGVEDLIGEWLLEKIGR